MTTTAQSVPRYLALLGSPNSGKTTLFNRLTGLRARVGNYPGVTVERIEGEIKLTGSDRVLLVDLPGTYGMEALSDEERVTQQYLEGSFSDGHKPDGIIFVADATTLARSLPMLAAILKTETPVILALTMIDEIKARGGAVDDLKLRKLLGIPVVGIVGNRGIGVDDLKALVARADGWKRTTPARPVPDDIIERFAWADEILGDSFRAPQKGTPLTDGIDSVLLHPLGGVAVFVAVMVLFFQAIFNWAAPLMDGVEGLFVFLSGFLSSRMADGWLRSLLCDGIIAGVGSVMVFIPQLFLLFGLLAFLENVGYMARAAFVVDRAMGWFGLDGRCFVALMSSYACAIPGIMAARTIPDPKSRLATILVAPFMTCSARLPVYVLLISAFVPRTTVWGLFGLQGLVMFGLYLLGGVTGLLAAAILRRGMLRGHTLPFYIELPPYRWPTAKTLFTAVWRPISLFLKRVGTIILAASLILWMMLSFPKVQAPAEVTARGTQAVKAYELEHSFAGRVGHAIEPLIRPLGFDWRIGVGLIASIAAREVIVSTMAQLFALGDGDDARDNLAESLKNSRYPPGHPQAGNPIYTLPVALSLLVFFVFALQCVSTLAVMRRETGGWKWPVVAWLFMITLAYVSAWLTFAVSSKLLLG
ncbi:MAG: ferrous iron transporter B [Myxococcales bacterium]|nr:ferrous iron transporter B [Myxococcales bacterium]